MRSLKQAWARPGVTTAFAVDMICASGAPAMAAFEEEERPKKKVSHEIGQDLTLLSVRELDERIVLLRDEIARLEANKTGKQASMRAADQLFKK
jgi:uncharacterized small protein (DUF1192 family)